LYNENKEGVRKLKVKKKDIKMISQLCMLGSLITVILAAFGATGSDFWLASTQWLLVAAVLAAFGIYFRMES
jgi:pheromone shutdown protein TraB